MIPTNLYTQTIQTAPKTVYMQPAPQITTEESFDIYFNAAEKNATAQAFADAARTGNQAQPKDAAENADTLQQDNPMNADTADQKTDIVRNDQAKPAEKKAIENKSEEFTEEEFGAASREIIEKLASALGMPMEAIQKLLVSANIKPLALQDNAVANTFVQKLFDVTSPAELLTQPNVQETIGKVKAVMAEYEAIAAEFLQKLENEEIGKPKFIDAGRAHQPQFASAVYIKEPVAVAEMIASEPMDAMPSETPDATEKAVTKDAADNKMTVPITDQQNESNTTGQFFSQSDSETTDASPHADTEEVIAAMPAATVFDAKINFEKVVIQREAVKNINTEDVIRQIAEKIKIDVKGETTEMKLSLRPEQLGEVTLKIAAQNGVVTAQFIAESQRVKEVIEAGFQQLKETLQQQGITVSQLSVSVGQENAEKQLRDFHRQQEKSSKRIQSMINAIAMPSEKDLAKTYAEDTDLYDIQVDYKA